MSRGFKAPACAAVLGVLVFSTPVWAMDRVRRETRTEEAVARYGVTGKGVLIAIIDRGIDWTHPDFRKPDGSTRIRAMLDLSGQDWCYPKNPPSVEYSEEQINAALSGGPAVRLRDAVGHGTLTAAVAAGNGRASANGRYRGIAPEADLLIVKATSDGAPAHDGFPAEAVFVGCMDEALNWVDKKATALNQPVVAIINSGVQWGPIDGTSAASRKIDAVFGLNRPGRIYVAPAGDEAGYPSHAGGDFDENSDAVVRFDKIADTAVYAALWYSGQVPAAITVVFDDGTVVGPVKPGQTVTKAGVTIGQQLPGQEFYPWQSTSGDRSAGFYVNGHKGPGVFKLRALKSGQGRFDIYTDMRGPDFAPVIQLTDHLVEGRLNDYASTKSAIVVGNAVVRTSYLDVDGQRRDFDEGGKTDHLWKYSPSGPTRDGRLRGVDIVAPGQNLFAAIGRSSYWGTLRGNLIEQGGGWYCRFGGTSASAPVVVGAVALMLQKQPQLTAREARDILCDTAKMDDITGPVPNADWGCGRLDVLAALQRLEPAKFEPATHER